MEHTPGPWEAVELHADGAIIRQSGFEIRTPEYDIVAHMTHRPPIRREDDAVLIAAAPDLLAACEKALKFIQNGVELGYIQLPESDDPALEVEPALRAAIAKAKGG